MKRILAIVLLLLSGTVSFAQDSLTTPKRSTKSYIIVDKTEKDIAYLKAKSRQAGLDLGLSVLANRVKTNSRHVGPMPSKHLLKQGVLQLQLPMNETQDEFAVYHSELFSIPSTINVLQIGDEIITYRTMETTGDIHLLYHCTRGAYGTRKSAHAKDAPVYKLWDTPERTLLPDFVLQNQMAQAEAKRLAKTDFTLLVFNDMKSYTYNDQGDLSIAHFLDTMHKYNPDKLLQTDLYTPSAGNYLSRVNENQVWKESMRTKIVETLTEKQEYYRKNRMPWMIGTFQILLSNKNKVATTMEELEWFLSKAAAFEAGFGLDVSAETLRQHGLTDKILSTINLWETLRLAGGFSEEQKEQFKDPYGNWHIEKDSDTTCLLYPQYISRRYYCHLNDDHWEWTSPYPGPFALQIVVEGIGGISNPSFRTPNGTLYLPCSVKAGQCLMYGFDGKAYVTDMNYYTLEEVTPMGVSVLDEGVSEVSFQCEVNTEGIKPEVRLRFLTRGQAETLILR